MLAQKVLKADLHGCLIKGTSILYTAETLRANDVFNIVPIICWLVAESKSVSTVGLEGIILQETQNTFRIICPDDRVKSEVDFVLQMHVQKKKFFLVLSLFFFQKQLKFYSTAIVNSNACFNCY